MDFRRRLGLCILLGLSLFTMAMAIVKAVNAQGRTEGEETQYEAALAVVWSILEQTLVIIMGCAPALTSIAQLRLGDRLLSISSSLTRLVKSSSKSYSTDESSGTAQRSDGLYYELGNPGQTLSQVHTGKIGASFDKSDGTSIDDGKIRRTDQYVVNREKEARKASVDNTHAV